MCTAISYKTKDHYFGRTLDYTYSYPSEITVVPRRFPFHFRNGMTLEPHHAMIGMAYVIEGYPLYFDTINEMGLAMAGLNFIGSAVYFDLIEGKDNIAQFEFIPWILGQASTVTEAQVLLERINITNEAFKKELPVSQLHWIIADREKSIIVESVSDGIKIYDNPVGVLTNNPSFPEQMFNLNNYMHLSTSTPHNLFSDKINLFAYSQGMGGLGLPGDLSSQSRFVRASFVKCNSVSSDDENESVNQFFHILASVEQQRGCCIAENGEFEITIYTSCCNADRGIYYYTTYGNHSITGVDMHKLDLKGDSLICFPLTTEEQIKWQN